MQLYMILIKVTMITDRIANNENG